MEHYLATLHKRPHQHKRRFALGVSTMVTALIFTFWSMATFGPGGLLSSDEGQVAKNVPKEVSPLESLTSSVSASLDDILDSFKSLVGEVETVDIRSDYTEMKDNVFQTYGQ